MKALVLKDYYKFQVEDVPVPRPARDEVLVEVMACAVCGSDVHGMDGSTGRRIPPIIMGHEASGRIVECGAEVRGYKVGDRVTFDSTIYCNRCEMCRSGRVNLCSHRKVLGVSCEEYRLDGAFAQYLTVPEHVLYHLPGAVSYREAAMVEPLSVAYHATTQAEIRPGISVAVVGIGTIGLLLQQVLRSKGVDRIVAVDVDDRRLEMARGHGATHLINSGTSGAAERILKEIPGGVDIAFDATGTQETFDLCLDIVRLDGDVVLIGNVFKHIDMRLQWIVTRQISLHGSCASSGEYGECLELIADGKVDVSSLISAAVPLEKGAEWIQRVYQREPGIYKIMLLPNGGEEA